MNRGKADRSTFGDLISASGSTLRTFLNGPLNVYAITNRHAPRRLVVDIFMEEVAGKANKNSDASSQHSTAPRNGLAASAMPRQAAGSAVQPVPQCIK